MDLNRIEHLLSENEEQMILDCLKESYKIKLNEKTGDPESLNATEEDLKILNNVYQKALLSSNHLLLKESIRCLRNCVIKNTNVQDKVLILNENLLVSCQDLLNDKTPRDLKNMLLTFLINICIGNTKNSTVVWSSLNFNSLIQQGESISKNLFALTYNIFLSYGEVTPDLEYFIHLLAILREDKCNEFAHFTLDLFLRNGHIFKYYDDFKNTEDRIFILEQLKMLQMSKEITRWSKETVVILSTHFKQKSDCILKTVVDYVDQIEPYEVSLLADVIASISADEHFLKMIQYDRSLLINCAFLLKSMHEAGKQGENHFAPISKLSKSEDLKEDIRNHPAFRFRVDMIRILGNLAWKTRCNQDEMRELDVIPLLLDCCNIDERNPFITQWVVFAIRNLCENNIDNQKIIASLNKQGVVDSAMLNQLGLVRPEDGVNTINIAALNTK